MVKVPSCSPQPAAGKTGTTDDSRDAYFVGYTPDLVTGVWVGDDNNKKVPGLYGGTVPARIWKDVMTVATKDLGANDFEYPVIELENYHASFSKAKVIGDDENPSNENKETAAPQETSSEQIPNSETEPTVNSAQTSAPAAGQTAEKESNAPKPQGAPVPKPSEKPKAPIPMAVPESLR